MTGPNLLITQPGSVGLPITKNLNWRFCTVNTVNKDSKSDRYIGKDKFEHMTCKQIIDKIVQ